MGKKILKELIDILPISYIRSVLGVISPICSIIYVIISQLFFTSDKTKDNTTLYFKILFFGGIIVFLVMWIIFIICAYKEQEKNINKNLEEERLLFEKNVKKCFKCAKEKSEDGFHYHGLLTLNELEAYESSLSDTSHPEKCLILVYTSDLATEKDALEQVLKNRESGIPYIIFYFQNSCTHEETEEMKKIYGKDYLIDLSSKDYFKESFDGRLAHTLGFDIMIYQNHNGEKKGFFSVDFIPETNCPRDSHTPHCKEKCNYGVISSQKAKDPSYRKVPFYKEMSEEMVSVLYREMREIHNNRKVEWGN